MTFNRAAHTYDQDFTQHSIAAYLRGQVWERLDDLFLPEMRVLEWGCGTGEDALYLAQKGIKVIATDASPAMLEVTRAKAQTKSIPLMVQRFDFNDPTSWQVVGPLDGVYSNFGALNCTPHWAALAEWLAPRLKAGAKLGFGVMGRFCLWETLWHGLHGDFGTASRRWTGQNTATLADGSQVEVFYPSPKTLIKAFSSHFQLKEWVGMGVFLPSSDIYPVIEARPRLQNALTGLEYHLAGRRPFRNWADHYWIEFERR